MGLIPLPYRLIAIGLLIAAVGVFGFVKGLQWNEAKHQKFVAQVEAQGIEAQARTAQRTKEAKEITENVAKAWDANTRRTIAIYDARLHNARSAAGRVPDAPAPAPRPHEFREPRAIPDTGLRERISELEITIAFLEKRLAKAAEDIEAWKAYGRKVVEWANANPQTAGRSL